MVGVGRGIWEGGRRKSFLSLPPRTSSSSQEREIQIRRTETARGILGRSPIPVFPPRIWCPVSKSWEERSLLSPRAMGSSVPNFAFQDIGEVPALISFYSFSSFTLCESSWDMKRGGGLESKRMRMAKPDAGGLIPRPGVMCSGVAPPPFFAASFSAEQKK